MKKFDSRHLVFHILVSLYFIWMVVFCILLGMAMFNTSKNADVTLAALFMQWIFTNFIMGSVLFLVIRLFRNRTLLDKIILYSYCFMALTSIAVALIIRQ